MQVELIAYTPNADELCARCAKTCYADFTPDNANVSVLDHAIVSGHQSVLEHATFTFKISGVSRALTHQLVRHRVGTAFSQQSQRYVSMTCADYVMPESIEKDPNAKMEFQKAMDKVWTTYSHLVKKYNIPKEDARYVLPNACTSNIVVTMNARELRHFFELRCCNRAQWEIRELADEMRKLVKEVAPKCFENSGPKCVTGKCCEIKSCGHPREEMRYD